MKTSVLAFSCLTILGLLTGPSFAETKKVDSFGDPVSGKSSINMKDVPIVGGGDWRSEKANIPWSIPVLVRDEFDGDYLAVLDRNYQKNVLTNEESGIISNWSQNYLRIYSYTAIKRCNGLFCSKSQVATRETTKVAIKAGDKVFRLTGENGNFKLTPDMAYALKNTPAGEAKIKVQFEGSGVEVVSDIGPGTVKSWQTVYQDAQAPKK